LWRLKTPAAKKVDRRLQVLDHRIGGDQPGTRFDQRRL
jgi:hypothetical protein